MNIESPNKKYVVDGKLMYSCQYHVIICTKYRRKVLVDDADLQLKEMMLDQQTRIGYKVLELEVMPDHVHLLVEANPKVGVYRQMARLKGYTSRMMKIKNHKVKTRLPNLWSRAMFISSVGSVSLDAVKSYIENQKNV